MGLSNDHIESIANAVKDSILPLDLHVRKVAKDLETYWRINRIKRNNLERVSGSRSCVRNCSVLLRPGKNKSYDGTGNTTWNNGDCLASEGIQNGFSILLSREAIFGVFSCNAVNETSKNEMLGRLSNSQMPNADEDDLGLLRSFVGELKPGVLCEVKNAEGTDEQTKEDITQKRKLMSCKSPLGFIFRQLTRNLQKLDPFARESANGGLDFSEASSKCLNNHLKAENSNLNGQKADMAGFLGNLKFASVGSLISRAAGVTFSVNEGSDDGISAGNEDDSGICVDSPKKLLKCSSTDYPNKEKLCTVQDFFKYIEIEGRRFFEELDRDNDGQITVEDLEMAMRKRELPKRYAKEFMNRTRSHLFSGSFGWKQFQSFMEHKEPAILQAYISLCLGKSGTLQKSEVLASLKNAGVLSSDENAVAMMQFLTMDAAEPVSYAHFRNFVLLLPSDRLKDDTRSQWFKAASAASAAPHSRLDAGSLLKSALAGGISCAFSAFLMHPVDTVKTQVQASSTLSFVEILSKIPEIGARGLYKGSVPAVAGQFASHGLRTSIYEASRLALAHVAPTLPDIQVQSVASFIGTFLGTAMRIPCEVLKQRLQANLFDNVVEATTATWHQDGLKGFFRGTGVTLMREIPFYVAGMGLFNESKKAVERQLERELEPWETIAVGALTGGSTAVLTTPFDVIKTRMMTAPQGIHISFWMAAYSILTQEGVLAFYKGAVPRFFWTAPLGALNLAGYELLRKALHNPS